MSVEDTNQERQLVYAEAKETPKEQEEQVNSTHLEGSTEEDSTLGQTPAVNSKQTAKQHTRRAFSASKLSPSEWG